MLSHTKKIPGLWFSVIAVTLMAFATPKDKREAVSAKLIDKNVAKVTDSLYAYRYETSNFDYLSFLRSIQQSNLALYDRVLWDTLVWRSELTYCEPLVEFYQRHPGFFDYPVVGVSYDGALEYCKWLTELYHSDPKRKFKKVVFVLPTQAEWEMAARAGRKEAMYPWGNYYLRNKKGEYLCNFKRINETAIVRGKDGRPVVIDSLSYLGSVISGGLNDRAFYTANVRSFYPNDFGLYNMCGNVAEMVAEKGISKGGGFNSYGGEIHIRAVAHYEDVAADLGFRVFMKVLEE